MEVKTAEPQDRLLRKNDVVDRLALSKRSVDRLVTSGKLEKVKEMEWIIFL